MFINFLPFDTANENLFYVSFCEHCINNTIMKHVQAQNMFNCKIHTTLQSILNNYSRLVCSDRLHKTTQMVDYAYLIFFDLSGNELSKNRSQKQKT